MHLPLANGLLTRLPVRGGVMSYEMRFDGLGASGTGEAAGAVMGLLSSLAYSHACYESRSAEAIKAFEERTAGPIYGVMAPYIVAAMNLGKLAAHGLDHELPEQLERIKAALEAHIDALKDHLALPENKGGPFPCLICPELGLVHEEED